VGLGLEEMMAMEFPHGEKMKKATKTLVKRGEKENGGVDKTQRYFASY
jgi:hypothetical protein